MSQQDWMLMQRIASGDQQAVAELYDRFSALVFKTARQLLPTPSDADDAVQEVFVRLWQTADRYDPRRAKLVTWVMLIARRHLIDRLRRHSARKDTTTVETDLTRSDEASGPETGSTNEERNARILERLAELPELQQTVIERAYLHGFTLREISEQLDAPLGTVKSALSRGLKRLRDKKRSDWAI